MIADGVASAPDISIYDCPLMMLRRQSIALSVVQTAAYQPFQVHIHILSLFLSFFLAFSAFVVPLFFLLSLLSCFILVLILIHSYLSYLISYSHSFLYLISHSFLSLILFLIKTLGCVPSCESLQQLAMSAGGSQNKQKVLKYAFWCFNRCSYDLVSISS